MNTWQLQEAKSKFSAMIAKALTEGPQFVTKRGKPAVVILSVKEYERFISPRKSFKEFLFSANLSDIELERRQGTDRGEES